MLTRRRMLRRRQGRRAVRLSTGQGVLNCTVSSLLMQIRIPMRVVREPSIMMIITSLHVYLFAGGMHTRRWGVPSIRNGCVRQRLYRQSGTSGLARAAPGRARAVAIGLRATAPFALARPTSMAAVDLASCISLLVRIVGLCRRLSWLVIWIIWRQADISSTPRRHRKRHWRLRFPREWVVAFWQGCSSLAACTAAAIDVNSRQRRRPPAVRVAGNWQLGRGPPAW